MSEFSLPAIQTLGAIDRSILSAERRLARAPSLAAPQQARVAEAKKALEELKAKNNQAKLTLKQLESSVRVKEEEIGKTNVALNTAKSNDEYQTLLRKIDRLKQEVSDTETQILEAFEGQDGRDAEVKRYEARLKEQEAELKLALARVKAEEDEINAELDGLRKQREEAASAIQDDHLGLYDKVLSKTKDSAIAQIVNENCAACGLRVRPDQISQARGEKLIVTCTSCGRILHL
ncbi:MAG: hypothetical protein KDD82_22660 [Planctomycetes bacterium]|nr:hypothetical protein [Planctomycetota bacterium]